MTQMNLHVTQSKWPRNFDIFCSEVGYKTAENIKHGLKIVNLRKNVLCNKHTFPLKPLNDLKVMIPINCLKIPSAMNMT